MEQELLPQRKIIKGAWVSDLVLKRFGNVDLSDPFFDSLKSDYKKFPEWFARKANNNAFVSYDDDGQINGFLHLKEEFEELTDITPTMPALHRVKVATMKVAPHGTLLGERFIKKIFDNAVFNKKAKEIYATIFPKHSQLIELLKVYGFCEYGKKTTADGEELVLVRSLAEPYKDVLLSYPFIQVANHGIFLLSIYPEYHSRLFPDSLLKTENPDIIRDISHANSIHKIYLARMSGVETLKRGDILVIYRTADKQKSAEYSAVATSVCIIEEYAHTNSFTSKDDYIKYCRKYTVFSEDELSDYWKTRKYPHIIRFTYNIALKKRIIRKDLIEKIGLDRNKYFGFMPLETEMFQNILDMGLVDESLIIH
jgi:L-amino acid N-acyltransferase YncA